MKVFIKTLRLHRYKHASKKYLFRTNEINKTVLKLNNNQN